MKPTNDIFSLQKVVEKLSSCQYCLLWVWRSINRSFAILRPNVSKHDDLIVSLWFLIRCLWILPLSLKLFITFIRIPWPILFPVKVSRSWASKTYQLKPLSKFNSFNMHVIESFHLTVGAEEMFAIMIARNKE